MLADASREHESVQAAGGSGQGSDFACRTIHKQIDGFARTRLLADQQLTHVAANSGYSQQTRLVIQQSFNGLDAHTLFLQQIKHNDRIKDTCLLYTSPSPRD